MHAMNYVNALVGAQMPFDGKRMIHGGCEAAVDV